MRKIVVIIAIIILVVAGCYLYKRDSSNEHEDIIVEDEIIEKNSISNADTEINEIADEINIYDIEDGYLMVKYNAAATIHEYNWDKYLNNNSMYYNYEDDNYKSTLGIDVSEYQGNIDWKKVRDSGVEFAILRLGYRGYGQAGRLVLDKGFEEYYKNATDNGIEIGVYFFSQAINIDEAMEEAEFLLNNIGNKRITYPVVFDLEKIKNDTARTDKLTGEEITNIALTFCKKIESSGYTACVYGNSKTFTTKMKLELFNGYKKWYADYLKEPLYPYEFSIWQYTETGKIDGIDGNVDMDICFIKKEK